MQKLRISRLLISTLPESTTASPGPYTERTLGPKPAVVPGQEFTLSPSMKLDPSMAIEEGPGLGVPLTRPLMIAGPLIAGSREFSLMTYGGSPTGRIMIVLPPVLEFALLC